MNNNIFNYEPNIDFEKHIFWQYNNAPNLTSLIKQKEDWYKTNHETFWKNWANNVLNVDTANDYGLSVWAKLLRLPRTYDVEGELIELTTEQFRTLIKAKLLQLRTKGTVPDINFFLSTIFGEYGHAYVQDNYDMTMTYHFQFNLTPLQIEVLKVTNLLPRPAGVKYNLIAVSTEVFGFNGSGCQPFDQAPFAVYTPII